MKANRVTIVSNLRFEKGCWLYKNNQYFYMVNGEIGEELPTISAQHKDLLEKHGIPFRPVSECVLEYWSPQKYEEKEVTLPLYIPYEGAYRFIKRHTGSIITEETVEKAFAVMAEVILPALNKLEEEQQREQQSAKIARQLAEHLNGCPSIGLSYELCDIPYLVGEETDFSYGKKQIKFIPVYMKGTMRNKEMHYISEYYAIFDMNNLPDNGILELSVPAGSEGTFIGKGGWQVKEWCKKLGMRHINVVTAK